MQNRNSNDNPWRAAGLVGAVSADLVVCIVLGYLGGSWLSDRMGEQKYVAIGTLVGLFVGIISVMLLIRFYVKDSK
jgi:uncharacterized protein YqgC (DUF456 family)